jgi:organic hydroperoxide reductase OsmC/OhrA
MLRRANRRTDPLQAWRFSTMLRSCATITRGRATMPTHHFSARLAWRKGGEGGAAGNHRVELDGRPAIELSGAPQYRGDPTRTNPEELFLAALASCQLLTYLALAARAGLDVLAYDDRAEATLAIADKKMRITEVRLRPRITLAVGADEAKARALVEAAHEGCFIANSVACAVVTEPEFTHG